MFRSFQSGSGRIAATLVSVLLLVDLAWSGSYKVLHVFQKNSQIPSSGLIVDTAGNAYGTTAKGGFNNAGTVYELSPTTGYQIIYAFSGHPDGRNPQGNLVIDSAGNLYGTTVYGGAFTNCNGGLGCGTVFELTPPKNGGLWTETILYSFSGGDDGSNPQAGVILDAGGNLCGTTGGGGSFEAGTVFQVTREPNNQWTQTVLYTFMGNGADGGSPLGGLVIDPAGNFYGTASKNGPLNGGVVFELFPSQGGEWTYEVIYAFDALFGPDGNSPATGLTFDGSGNLYGTTVLGGTFGFGTVFQLTNNQGSWTENLLHNFAGGNDGASPLGSLVLDTSGNIFGTTQQGGGSQSLGTAFKLTTGQWRENVFPFQSVPGRGAHPAAPLLLDGTGGIYGTAEVIFKIMQ